MGSWGYHSDENDDTYDYIGAGIAERVHGAKLIKSKVGKGTTSVLKEIRKKEIKKSLTKAAKVKNNTSMYPGYPTVLAGVVRFYLKDGEKVDIKFINQSLKDLEKELNCIKKDYVGCVNPGWKTKRRERAIKKEIEELKYAKRNKGFGKKGKHRGIFG